MIAHVFRLAWNRRRENALVLVELLLSFLVLCLVSGAGVFVLDNWRRPLGFDWRGVWVVYAEPDVWPGDGAQVARGLAAVRAVVAALAEHPEIEAATPITNVPYTSSTSQYGIYSGRRLVQYLWLPVTPEAREVLRLELVEGRWLEDGDERLGYTPVVINRELSRTLFGGSSPIGKPVPRENEDGSARPWQDPRDEQRVVGVVSDFRKHGEPSPPGGAAFAPTQLEDAERGEIPRAFLARIGAGVPAQFEELLVRSLNRAAPGWSFRVEPLAAERRRSLRGWLLPFGVCALVAGFLVLTAGMGLIGVLWQNVSRRRAEIGIRRAFGSTGGEVQGLILMEVSALALLAVGAGSALFFQLPLLGVFPAVGAGVYLFGAAIATVSLLGVVLLCALHPSRLATRVQPAEALRWE